MLPIFSTTQVAMYSHFKPTSQKYCVYYYHLYLRNELFIYEWKCCHHRQYPSGVQIHSILIYKWFNLIISIIRILYPFIFSCFQTNETQKHVKHVNSLAEFKNENRNKKNKKTNHIITINSMVTSFNHNNHFHNSLLFFIFF